MKRLLCLLLLIPATAGAGEKNIIKAKIRAEARRQQVNEEVALAVAFIESSYRPEARNKEYRQGKYIGESLGVYQVKITTAREFCGIKTRKELLQPDNNIRCGISYLKYQIGRYKSLEKGVLAYNSGSYKERQGRAVNWRYYERFKMALEKIREGEG